MISNKNKINEKKKYRFNEYNNKIKRSAEYRY